jgi:hypothetical protein
MIAIMTILFLVVIGLLAVGMALVVFGTLVENKWGINPSQVQCPRRGAALRRLRTPRSLRQRLWGGYTCPNCAAEVDKWGRKIASR